jgi:hypothetical protein
MLSSLLAERESRAPCRGDCSDSDWSARYSVENRENELLYKLPRPKYPDQGRK